MEKTDKGIQDAILFDGMASAVLIAFAFEAKLNFMGSQLVRNGKLADWNEFQSHTKKLKKVFDVLGIPIELEKRPLSSMQKMKTLRDVLAHGKPAEAKTDEIVVGFPEELDRKVDLRAGWETYCTSDAVFEALEDLDQLWKLMIEKSGLRAFDTMTQADGSITVLEHVD
jgi:hypothetical protein